MPTMQERAKANQAKRAKMRGNRASIDSIKMGPEPFWDEGECPPFEKESERRIQWSKAAQWYNYFYKSKDFIPYVLRYAEEVHGFDKKDIQALKAVEDWRLYHGNGAVSRLHFRGWIHEDEVHERMGKKLKELKLMGAENLKNKKEEAKSAPPPISIAERTRMKMMDTIYAAWDETIVEGWFEKDYKRELDVYTLFKENGLKGNAVEPFKKIIQGVYEEVSDAVNKTCEQAVEAYSHITPANKKKMLKQMDNIFADLDKLKLSFKATRAPRSIKRKSTDDQVKNLKYMQENNEYKISSINPVTIPGKETLFIFNTKNRTLYQYVTTATAGFELGGTSIKNFEPKLSKCTRLRKPDDILPLILTKTPKQIESQVWKTVTTKVNPCNGRVNADCVLLRVL